jgi:hypothetical protein
MKVLQALFYIQNKTPINNQSKFDIFYLLKLVFFANRYHLRHFGFVTSGCKYFATRVGVVSSPEKDVIEGTSPFYPIGKNGPLFHELNEQKDDALSESFKQSLDFAVRIYGKYTQFQLSNISKDYPEWKKHEKAINSGIKFVPVDFVDFFDDPEDLLNSKACGINEDPFKDDIDFLNALKEDFSEKNID